MRLGIRRMVPTLIVVLLVGCNDAPTQPPTQTAPAAPTAPAIPGDLSGQWAGTFTYLTCSEVVRPTLSQSGNSIYGSFTTGCFAPGPPWVGDLIGTIQGTSLTLELWTNDQFVARMHGTGSPALIHVSTTGPISLHLSRFTPHWESLPTRSSVHGK